MEAPLTPEEDREILDKLKEALKTPSLAESTQLTNTILYGIYRVLLDIKWSAK